MQVDTVDEYPYVVVQFLQLPYANIGSYTCVPQSWIRIRRATDRKIVVAYPDESPSITKMRIMNCDKPSKKWKHYMAIIKHETYSYEDAYELIMGKLRNASKNRYSAATSTDYEFVPATTTERYSYLLKSTNLLESQLKKNENELNGVNKARRADTISNSSKPPTRPNVESTIPSSSQLPGHVSPESTMMMETDGREYQEQITQDVRPRLGDLLHRHSHLQRILEKGNGIQANSPWAGSQNITRKTVHASRNPVIVNQNCDYSQQLQQNQQLSIHRDHFHLTALTHGIQKKGFSNLPTFNLEVPKPLIWNLNIEPNTSFVIQNRINKANQSSQLKISLSKPVNQDHPLVPSTQKAPGQSSEVECDIPKPTSHSDMTNDLYASIGGSKPAECQDLSLEEMVIDEKSKVSCAEQSVLSERRAGNKSSAVPNIFKNANCSGQSAVRSMEEGLPINDDITSNDVSSTQDVDDNDLSNYPEISSEEILTASPNSNEPVDQSVDSEINKADVLADQLFDLFQRIKVDSSQACQIVHDLHQSLIQSHKVIECIVNATENLRESTKGKITVETSKEVTVGVQQMAEENQAEKKDEGNSDVNMEGDKKKDNDEDFKISKNDDDDDVVDDDDDRNTKDDTDESRDDEVLKTTRGHIRTFVLPPEYDPDDTRWTLKYRKYDPELNLVELVPQSNVFIESIKLAHCKRVSKDGKMLARMLLVEIFSQIALSVCSLTGARANAFDISGTNVRPGLDEPARMAILSFVEEHALTKKWGAFDSQSVINSLRSKIQEIRAKYGKTA